MESKFGLIGFLVLLLAWEAHSAVNCTETGVGRFPEPTDTTCKNYSLCVLIPANNTFVSYDYTCPSTSFFSPITSQCTADYVCNATPTNATTSVCTADGYIADPSSTDCSSYIECVNIDGTFTETVYTCPTDTFYNPNNTLCESDYNCIIPFECAAAGRFANPNDATCQTYFFCVVDATGAFAQYNYTCPSTSVFSPTARICTTAYTCPS